MIKLLNARNYIVVKTRQELVEAMNCHLCSFIIKEGNNYITLWERYLGTWHKKVYSYDKSNIVEDDNTTGLEAYRLFYKYCGKEEVEKMKYYYTPIASWESYEQLHYYNPIYAKQKIYENIYEFDANSAFTYGSLQLPDVFSSLKEYMLGLYKNKKNAIDKVHRKRYKNLQNFLIGYFARIKQFVAVRSNIINYSNLNIQLRMAEITNKGGKVFLSNTDSIITDDIGCDIMQKYVGDEVGLFKLEKIVDRLYYVSSNAYQLGDEIKYSGVRYFAKQNTDFFNDVVGVQSGSFIKQYDFSIESDGVLSKLCRVEKDIIYVDVYTTIGEYIKTVIYRL